MTSKNQSSAAELLRALGAPIHNSVIRKEVGAGTLDYEVYLRTQALLSLQTPANELIVPDELLFQVMHQAQELWLKALAFEAVSLVRALDEDALPAANAALVRMVSITRCLGSEIRILQTLAPQAFQTIRRQLGNGSGMESPGYNQLQVAAAAIKGALERILARRGIELAALYLDPLAAPDLYNVVEQFVDLDEAFQTWLFAHFMLVRRTIGVDKTVRALDGFPTVALAARMTKPLFPELWEVRVQLTKEWDRGGGFAPGESRSAVASGTSRVASAVSDFAAHGEDPEEPARPAER